MGHIDTKLWPLIQLIVSAYTVKHLQWLQHSPWGKLQMSKFCLLKVVFLSSQSLRLLLCAITLWNIMKRTCLFSTSLIWGDVLHQNELLQEDNCRKVSKGSREEFGLYLKGPLATLFPDSWLNI